MPSDIDVRAAGERGVTMSSGLITFILVVAIFFCVLYLIWMLPVSWRVRQIIQVLVVILGLVYLLQHQALLRFW